MNNSSYSKAFDTQKEDIASGWKLFLADQHHDSYHLENAMQTKYVECTNKKGGGDLHIESSIPLKIHFYGYRKAISYYDLDVELRKRMDSPYLFALHASKK